MFLWLFKTIRLRSRATSNREMKIILFSNQSKKLLVRAAHTSHLIPLFLSKNGSQFRLPCFVCCYCLDLFLFLFLESYDNNYYPIF